MGNLTNDKVSPLTADCNGSLNNLKKANPVVVFFALGRLLSWRLCSQRVLISNPPTLSELSHVKVLMNSSTSQLSKQALAGAKVDPATEVKLAKKGAPDGAANLMPPPTTALRPSAGRRSMGDALSASSATPVQPEYASRRPVTTPLTALVGATTVTPGTNFKPSSLSSAGGVVQTPAAHTRGFDAVERSMNGTSSIVSILDPSKHNIVAQSDAGISDEPFNELLTASPGTALAADILATAIREAPTEASPGTEDLDPHGVSTGHVNGDEGNKGELYSRFSAAATPVSAKSKGSAASAKKTSTPTAGTKRKGKQLGSEDEEKIRSTVGPGVASYGCASGLNLDTKGVGALYSILIPPAKKRKARRWLTDDQKMFVCGIGGCARSYGSASSLCAHKRAHHPGWKEDRKRQLEAQVQSNAIFDGDNRNAVGEDEGTEQAEGEDKEEEDDEDEEGGDVAGRAARREGAAALDAVARCTLSGAWVESLAADTHGRLGALRRSRQRVQRGLRDARAASAKAPPPDMGGDVLGGSAKIAASAAESIASAAAARLLQQMEAALEAESERLQGWLGKLESIAELRMKTGKVIGFSHEERKVLNSGELEAMMVAEQTANAIASAACLTD